MKPDAKAILEAARAEATKVETWADLSNFLFDPYEGLISTTFPVGPERQEFMNTPEFKEIRRLINEAKERTGLVEGATPKRFGTFVVALPMSLRTALVSEAAREHLSLDQLVVAKLSMPMSQPLSSPST